MPPPKILLFAGSIRTGSYNARLAALAAKELTLAEADVTHVSLQDYPLPIYDNDLEVRAMPDHALKLKRMMTAHAGVFIVSPEYNASVTPLLKNAIDWISRVREHDEPPLAAYRNRVFALASASPGPYGGQRSLLALRQVLTAGCGALVIPDHVSVRHADKAFDEMDELVEAGAARALKNTVQRLVDMARLLG
ncbi:MAG TPA: NAD(P)H-dependent oxidoreductase [Pseudolabrys sp.]|nr:NAD(P)H-dependent oxidoreductase [Pseudolabrys sp.]